MRLLLCFLGKAFFLWESKSLELHNLELQSQKAQISQVHHWNNVIYFFYQLVPRAMYSTHWGPVAIHLGSILPLRGWHLIFLQVIISKMMQ